MKKGTILDDNEKGTVLLITIMLLVLMIIAAYTALQSSTVNMEISGNHLLHQKYFFAAEAGIDRAVQSLEQEYIANHKNSLGIGRRASWNFALAGGDRVRGTADDAVAWNDDGLGSYEGAAVWIENTVFDGSTYRVYLWNNDDSGVGGSYQDDRDGMVWVRCDATGPKGGGASIQVLLQGKDGGPVIVDYTAQSGTSPSRNFTSDDMNPIVDFSRQM